MHIYSSDISFLSSYDYHNVIAISREYASLPKVCCKYATLVLLAAWKTKLLFKFWMENIQQRKRAKCASLKSCHSFQFIAISNSAIINESINTAQLISYLNHRYTVHYNQRILVASFQNSGLNKNTPILAVSGFWLTKTPLIGHWVIEILIIFSVLTQGLKTIYI